MVLTMIGIARGMNWCLGAKGETCNQACESAGGTCPTNLNDYVGLIDTEDEAAAVFTSLSVTCNTYEPQDDDNVPKVKGEKG